MVLQAAPVGLQDRLINPWFSVLHLVIYTPRCLLLLFIYSSLDAVRDPGNGAGAHQHEAGVLLPKRFWRSTGLFVAPDLVLQLQNRILNDVFVLEKSEMLFELHGVCDMPSVLHVDQRLPECRGTPLGEAIGNNWAGTTHGCCSTKMQVEMPLQVRSVLSGQLFSVLQLPSSTQLVHTGRCLIEGGVCVLDGRCSSIYRIQWILVNATPLTTGGTSNIIYNSSASATGTDEITDQQLFVPAMVTNHCQCIFT